MDCQEIFLDEDISLGGIHLKSLINRLNTKGIADDPRYGERFCLIKAELEKRSGLDYQLIFKNSAALLEHEATDLRVASYLSFASAYIYSVNGLSFGLHLLATIMESKCDVFPKKNSARVSAVKWLCQNRTLFFLDSSQASTSEINDLNRSYQRFVLAGFDFLKEEVKWNELSQWIEAKSKREDVFFQKKEVSDGKEQQINSDAVKKNLEITSFKNHEINSESSYLKSYRGIIDYLRRQKKYATCVALSRAIKWHDIVIHSNENGVTRIDPPSKSDLSKVEALMKEGNWLDAFIASEDAFMNPGGAFYMEYQLLSYECAVKLNFSDVCKLVVGNLVSFVENNPSIKKLKYSDGTPFFTLKLSSWIKKIQKKSAAQGPRKIEDDIHIDGARKKAEEFGLTAALSYLDGLASSDLLSELRKKMHQVQICIEFSAYSLALSLIAGVYDSIIENSIDKIDRLLSLEVINKYIVVLEEMIALEKDSKVKILYKESLGEMKKKLVFIDVVSASELIF